MSVQHVVLRCLLDGPSHGYALQKRVTRLRNYYPLTNVNIYPVLKGLEGSGFVASRTEVADSRARRVYELTPEGESELSSWMAEAPADSFPFQQDPVGLKLVLAPSEAAGQLGWLESALRDFDAEIARTREELSQSLGEMPRLARMTDEWRLTMYEGRRRFLAEALRVLREIQAGAAGRSRA